MWWLVAVWLVCVATILVVWHLVVAPHLNNRRE